MVGWAERKRKEGDWPERRIDAYVMRREGERRMMEWCFRLRWWKKAIVEPQQFSGLSFHWMKDLQISIQDFYPNRVFFGSWFFFFYLIFYLSSGLFFNLFFETLFHFTPWVLFIACLTLLIFTVIRVDENCKKSSLTVVFLFLWQLSIPDCLLVQGLGAQI